MSVRCNDLERILRDADPVEMKALEEHAAICAACAEELRAWKSLSLAAREMHDEWESPALWHRIESSLSAAAQHAPPPSRRWNWLTAWTWSPLSWQTAAATVLLAALTAGGAWIFIHRSPAPTPRDLSLMTDSTLREVERAEAEYEQAIEKLAARAKPQLDNASTPLLANYREKLLVLDSAIAELRVEAGRNPGNAHLRNQLLAMYQQKQQTLGEILVEDSGAAGREKR